jgi:hypothetical protein
VLAGVMACSAESPGTSAGGSTGTGTGTGGGTSTAVLKGGSIVLSQASSSTVSGRPPDYIASASFFAPASGDSGAGGSCPQINEGSCTLSTCMAGSSETVVLAGTISITTPSASGTLTPFPGIGYVSVTSSLELWTKPGQTMSAQASGGEIPAFMLSTTAPGVIVIGVPVFPMSPGSIPTLPIPKSQDFAVTWSGTSPGNVIVSLSSPPNDQITCTFEPAAGHGTVPASLLGHLQQPQGVLTVNLTNGSTIEVAGYSVELVALSGILSGPVTFQ